MYLNDDTSRNYTCNIELNHNRNLILNKGLYSMLTIIVVGIVGS